MAALSLVEWAEGVVEWAQGNQKKFFFGHFFVDYCLKNAKIPVCLPAGKHKPPRGVKIGKISTFFQSKTLIPSSKNQIFQKFLTVLLTSSYETLKLRIEDFFRIKSAGSSNYRGATFFASGNKKINIEDPPSFGGLNLS